MTTSQALLLLCLASAAALPPLEKEVQKLKALGAPSGDEAKVEAILAALGEAVEAGKENPQSLLVAEQTPFNRANALAKAYGLRICASNP
jgi:hypothetical protein